METKLVPIGNSRGVRLPKSVLDQFHMKDGGRFLLETHKEGILLRPILDDRVRVSYEEAYGEMAAEAAEAEEWSEWDTLSGDGRDS